MSESDNVTILRSLDGRLLTKRNVGKPNGGWTTAPAPMPKFYDYAQEQVCGIRELSDLLTLLSHHRDLCVIRGEPVRPSCENDAAVQRLNENSYAVPRHWVMIDVDSVEIFGSVATFTSADELAPHLEQVISIAPWKPAIAARPRPP